MIARILLIFWFVFAVACGRQAESDSFAQAITPNTVRSAAFKISAEKPENWYVLSEELQEELVDQGGKVASYGNNDLAAKIEVSKPRTSQIFGIFKFEPGSPVESNPSVIAMAENVSLSPGVKTGEDYFFHFRRLAATSNAQYEFGDVTPIEIGGKDFHRLDVIMTLNGQSVQQSYFAARQGDDIILLIQSYNNESERAETDSIVQSVRFE